MKNLQEAKELKKKIYAVCLRASLMTLAVMAAIDQMKNGNTLAGGLFMILYIMMYSSVVNQVEAITRHKRHE